MEDSMDRCAGDGFEGSDGPEGIPGGDEHDELRESEPSQRHCVQVRLLDDYRGQEITRASAIRLRCLDCCGNLRAEVRECPAIECPAWQYRMGHHTPLSDEQRVMVAAHYERARQTGHRR